MRVLRLLALLTVVALVAAACRRADDGGSAAPEASPAGDTSAPSARGGLDAGAFGDLGTVCSDGDPEPVEGVTGIEGTKIRVANFHDAGFAARPGLNKELQDIGQAFVTWCNEHGGIRGYELVRDDRDVAFTEHANRVIESCQVDFAMVGGGAAIDDAGQEARLACGLPDFAGFVVTAEAAGADLVVQAVPNPVDELDVGAYEWLAEQFPDSIGRTGILVADFGTTKLQGERNRDALEQLGWKIAYDEAYPASGTDDWSPFVTAMDGEGVRAVFWSGEPGNLAAARRAMVDRGFEPDFVVTDTNHYDESYIDAGGDAVDGTFMRSSFYPFEEAADNEATAQYLEMLDRYDDDGKVALLGAQGLSAWLLFSTSLGQCIDEGDLTRDCVFDTARSVTEWTGGGLHARQDPSSGSPGGCYIVLEATADGFVRAPIDTTDGIYNCSPDNVIELRGDYGAGARCPSGKENPLPSECAG